MGFFSKNMKTHLNIIFAAIFFSCIGALSSQTATPAAKEADEFAKKAPETKLTEVIETDSVPATEIMARAKEWYKQEAPTYKKTNASNSGTKLECLVSFPVKPKELNPQVDYTGKVTMKVVIDCKSSKYRYTIREIKHTSKSGTCTGGSVDGLVPECGSMGMTDVVWKKLRGEMLAGASKVAADLKAVMNSTAPDAKADEW